MDFCESNKLKLKYWNILLNSVMYCHTLVSPGIGATLHTFFFLKVLITELFPTFGYLNLSKIQWKHLPNKADTNLLAIFVQSTELPQQLDKSSFTK